MSLSVALNSAQSSISTTASQTALTSRNISGSSDPAYSRKAGIVTTLGIGSVRVGSVQRATDMALFLKMLGATSTAASSQTQTDALKSLARTVGDPETDGSLAGALGKLSKSIQTYAETPNDPILARNMLTNAYDIVGTINAAQATTQEVRQAADAEIGTSVDRINEVLAKFETVNRAIVFGTVTGADVTDQLDTRDKLLAQISEEIGVSVIHRANNDMAVYTDSGVTLFEKTARTVSFTRTFALGPGATGAAVMADGVPITGPAATMPIKSGRIYGNAVVRDQTTVIYQRQLDATARGLVEAFAEAGVPGLFEAPLPPGAVAPPPGSIVAPPGTAGTLRVNAAADPALGGDLNRLRDGFGTPGYNPTGAAGFSGRLQELLGNLEAPQAFDPAAGINQTASLTRYTAASASWVEASRKQATEISTYQNTFLERTREALSNETGVNLDEELSLMLELERSYGASARIITVVDTMIKTLLDATRP